MFKRFHFPSKKNFKAYLSCHSEASLMFFSPTTFEGVIGLTFFLSFFQKFSMAWRRYDRTSFFTINSTNKDVEQSTCCQRRSHRSSRKTLGWEVPSFLAKLALVSEGLIGCQAVFQLKNIMKSLSASPTNKFIATNQRWANFPL